MKKNKVYGFAAALTLAAMVTAGGYVAQAQMGQPAKATISGTLVDMSCAAKGMAMMGAYVNIGETHKTPDGDKPNCATMCLKGGQPAGLFMDGKIGALLLANASLNLFQFATKDVEVQGWWAGGPKDDVKTFFPEKIRVKGSREWTDVITAEMH